MDMLIVRDDKSWRPAVSSRTNRSALAGSKAAHMQSVASAYLIFGEVTEWQRRLAVNQLSKDFTQVRVLPSPLIFSK